MIVSPINELIDILSYHNIASVVICGRLYVKHGKQWIKASFKNGIECIKWIGY